MIFSINAITSSSVCQRISSWAKDANKALFPILPLTQLWSFPLKGNSAMIHNNQSIAWPNWLVHLKWFWFEIEIHIIITMHFIKWVYKLKYHSKILAYLSNDVYFVVGNLKCCGQNIVFYQYAIFSLIYKFILSNHLKLNINEFKYFT